MITLIILRFSWNFDGIRLKILLRVEDFGKWVSIRRKNSLPTFGLRFGDRRIKPDGISSSISFVLPDDFVVG